MRRFDTTWIGIIAVLALAAPTAWGQYELGDGRALDRNLQRGSGGINAPRQRNTAGEYQDAIITGNVGGLARFRGGIDYRAAGEFSGPTAGDITYNFRRQSLPTVPLTRYQRQNLADQEGRPVNPLINPRQGTGTALIRPGSGVRSGQVSRGGGWYNNPNIETLRDDSSAPIGRRIDNSVDRDRLYREAEARRDPSLLGLNRTQDGRLLEVRASPLTGLRSRVIDERLDERARPDMLNRTASESTEEEGDGEERPNPPERVDRRVQPSVLSGQRLGQEPDRAESWDDSTPRDEDRFPHSISAEPGEDVYGDLLRRIQRQSDQAGEDRENEGSSTRPRNQLIPPPAEDGEAEPTDAIEDITERFFQTRAGEGDGPAASGGSEAVGDAADSLDYDLPPLRSLAGSAETGFNEAMAQAEAEMEEGRYFEADARYQRALTLRPGYPLAMAGRVHAQLAAGVFRSAATDLRRLLAEHPELIATRYSQPLLPGSERLEEVKGQLRRQAESDARPEAAMLLAYLAYQQDRPQAAQDALDTLQSLRPDDPLAPLLRRIWGSGSSDTGDTPPLPEAESSPDGSGDNPPLK